MIRKRVPTLSPYAEKLCFSRAVRAGNFVSVGGTAAMNDKGETVGMGDPGVQTRCCLDIITNALAEAGASLEDVIRTRIMLTNIDYWPQVAEVKASYFNGINPVDTVVEVSRFINPQWLIEIEVDAVISD